MKKILLLTLGLGLAGWVSTALAHDHGGDLNFNQGSSHENLEQEISLAATANAPTNALGLASLDTETDDATNITELKVSVAGLATGDYTVTALDVTGVSYSLGTFTASPYTSGGDHRFNRAGSSGACTNSPDGGTNAVTVNFGRGRFALPAALDATNVTSVFVADAFGTVDLSGNFSSATNLTGVLFNKTVAVTPGSATKAKGSASLALAYKKGKITGTFKLAVTGLTKSQKLTLTANGKMCGTTTATTSGAVNIQSLPGANLSTLKTVSAKDKNGSVLFSAKF
jgi:hypothetical protein